MNFKIWEAFISFSFRFAYIIADYMEKSNEVFAENRVDEKPSGLFHPEGVGGSMGENHISSSSVYFS